MAKIHLCKIIELPYIKKEPYLYDEFVKFICSKKHIVSLSQEQFDKVENKIVKNYAKKIEVLIRKYDIDSICDFLRISNTISNKSIFYDEEKEEYFIDVNFGGFIYIGNEEIMKKFIIFEEIQNYYVYNFENIYTQDIKKDAVYELFTRNKGFYCSNFNLIRELVFKGFLNKEFIREWTPSCFTDILV